MDWTMLLNGLVWVIGLLSVSFLAYGGWLCLRHLASERAQSRQRETVENRPVEQHRFVA
jgi:hypothetical protein